MHKHIGLVIVAAIVGALFFVPGAADKLFALVFIGVVPFTDYTLSVTAMLSIYALLLAIGFYAIIYQLRTVANPVKREMKSRERARKKILHSTKTSQHNTKQSRTKKHFLPATEKTT